MPEPYWKEGDSVPNMPECFRLSAPAANLANYIRQATLEESEPFVAYLDMHRGDPDTYPPYKPGDMIPAPDGSGLIRLEGEALFAAINAWMTGYEAGLLKGHIVSAYQPEGEDAS